MLSAIALLALVPIQTNDTDRLRGTYIGLFEPVAGEVASSRPEALSSFHLFFIRPSRYHIELPNVIIDGTVEWKGAVLTLRFERAMNHSTGSRQLKDIAIRGVDRADSDRVIKWITSNPQLTISTDLKRITPANLKALTQRKFYFERRWSE